MNEITVPGGVNSEPPATVVEVFAKRKLIFVL